VHINKTFLVIETPPLLDRLAFVSTKDF